MKITIDGKVSDDPRDRVLAIEAVTKAICESVGEDAADGTITLLTAAVHITMQFSGKQSKDVAQILGECLGCALVAADEFFTLRVA